MPALPDLDRDEFRDKMPEGEGGVTSNETDDIATLRDLFYRFRMFLFPPDNVLGSQYNIDS